ncbi:hypothetical protein Golob_021535, partial [Gossypium lobatum]|nr:hypothetical protein [Gossypium lobatum]
MRYFFMLVDESAWEAVKEGWSRPKFI